MTVAVLFPGLELVLLLEIPVLTDPSKQRSRILKVDTHLYMFGLITLNKGSGASTVLASVH